MAKDNKKTHSKTNYKKQNEIIKVSPAVNEIENNKTIIFATAPYNFISLPEKILPSEISSVENFKNHVKEHGNISGEIELEIETLTPLIIGNGNLEDVKNFAPAGKFIIPGSSLRGMFKNIFKIVTCGAFRGRTESQTKGEDFNDEHIYYRCLMGVGSLPWTKDLNSEYSKRMQSVKFEKATRKVEKKAIPGFLIKKTDGKYYIAPLDEGCYEGKISIKDKKFKYLEKSCVIWDGVAAYVFTGKGGKKKYVRYTEITDINWNNQKNWSAISDEVLKSYEHDRNRKGVNLLQDEENKPQNTGILNRLQLEKLFKDNKLNLKWLEGIETLVPCHYLKDDKKNISAFGHGQYFRIPYKNSIGDIVPANLQSEKIIDFADAIFGSKENWSSRVAFEDASITSTVKILATAAAHPLMQPNPTSYQLYLKQDSEILTHWDKSNAEIRGYKMYWHNKICNWQANSKERADLSKKLTPLAEGNKFKSKIRFKNLSEIELGALMMIFDLDGLKNPAYKIGMGKPFGFGSVKITPKLFIENDDAYTAEIFDSNGFKIPYSASESQEYIKVFKKYLEAKIGLKSWQNVMNELKAILDWKNKPAPEKIKSMSGDVSSDDVDERFKQRTPLPTIFEVVK